MAFIYYISDKNKSFNFKGKFRTTPCQITIYTIKDVKNLRNALKNKGIKNVRAERVNNKKRLNRKVPLNNGDGTIQLNYVTRN